MKSKWDYLFALFELKEARLSDIAKKTNTSASTARQRLLELLKKGILSQEKDMYSPTKDNTDTWHIFNIMKFCRNREINYNLFLTPEFAKVVKKSVKKIFFLEGDSSEEIKSELSAFSHQSSDKIGRTYNNLRKLLLDVKKIAKNGDIILFAPAATSFNLFQNEWDRGRKFNEAVEKVFR